MFLCRLILPDTGEIIEYPAKNMTSAMKKSISFFTFDSLEPDENITGYLKMIYINRQGLRNWKASNYHLIPDYDLIKEGTF